MSTNFIKIVNLFYFTLDNFWWFLLNYLNFSWFFKRIFCLINPLKFDFNYANYYSSVLLLGQCFSSLSTFSPIFPEFIGIFRQFIPIFIQFIQQKIVKKLEKIHANHYKFVEMFHTFGLTSDEFFPIFQTFFRILFDLIRWKFVTWDVRRRMFPSNKTKKKKPKS